MPHIQCLEAEFAYSYHPARKHSVYGKHLNTFVYICTRIKNHLINVAACLSGNKSG